MKNVNTIVIVDLTCLTLNIIHPHLVASPSHPLLVTHLSRCGDDAQFADNYTSFKMTDSHDVKSLQAGNGKQVS